MINLSRTKKQDLFFSIKKRDDDDVDLRLPVHYIHDDDDHDNSGGKEAAKTPPTNEPPLLLPSPSSSSSSNNNNNTDSIITAINDVDNNNDIEEQPPPSSDSVLSQGTVSPGGSGERSEDSSGSTSKSSAASTSSTRYPNNTTAGSSDLASLRAEKGRLHQMLRSSEKGFFRENRRRQVSSFADIKPVATQYRRHRAIKWQIATTRDNKYYKKDDGDDTAIGKKSSMQQDHAHYNILKDENIDDKLLDDAIRKGENEGKRTNAAMQIERAWKIFFLRSSNQPMPKKNALSQSRNDKDGKGKIDEDISNNPAVMESPNNDKVLESPSPVDALLQLPVTEQPPPPNFPTSNLERYMKNLTTYSFEDLMAAKRDVTATLKEYDRIFCRRHGRYPKKAEKEPIRCFYEAYYAIKAQILFLEIVQKELTKPNKGSPPEGMDDDYYILQMLKKEKKTVHGVLRAFEKKFCEENGRQVSSSLDIQPYNEQYNRYNRLKRLIADREMKMTTTAVAGGDAPDTSAGG